MSRVVTKEGKITREREISNNRSRIILIIGMCGLPILLLILITSFFKGSPLNADRKTKAGIISIPIFCFFEMYRCITKGQKIRNYLRRLLIIDYIILCWLAFLYYFLMPIG